MARKKSALKPHFASHHHRRENDKKCMDFFVAFSGERAHRIWVNICEKMLVELAPATIITTIEKYENWKIHCDAATIFQVYLKFPVLEN